MSKEAEGSEGKSGKYGIRELEITEGRSSSRKLPSVFEDQQGVIVQGGRRKNSRS